jgi:hypothetical protein
MNLVILLPIGQYLGKQMIEKTKYGFSFPQEAVVKNINRLTN